MTKTRHSRGAEPIPAQGQDEVVRGGDVAALEAMAQTSGETSGFFSRIDWSKAGLIIGLLVFGAASVVLYRILAEITWADVREAMERVEWQDVVAAFGATALSYIALMGYDFLALRHVGAKQVPLVGIAFTSFVSHAFTYTLGFGVVTGGAVRWRMYQGYGLKPAQILAVGALCALTFWLGITGVAGLCLLLQPQALAPVDGLSSSANLSLGLAIIGAVMIWLIISAIRPRHVTVGDWTLPLPGATATAGAILTGLADTAFAAGALWLILPAGPDPGFVSFLVVFAVATVLGVVSHVPGGVGVFEATMILAMPQIPKADLVGSLLLFRLVYYAVPFALASAMLGGFEMRQRRQAVGQIARTVGSIARPIVPRAAGVAVFLVGVVLLLSGATPAEHYRMAILKGLLPLEFIEGSHFFGSVIGLVLLVVAYGLVRRMANAWRLSIMLLIAGVVLSLQKGLDFEEATVCAVVIGLLLVSRNEFYRQADLFAVRPSFEWIVAVIVAIGASIWLGFFVSRNVEYQSYLWWDFGYRADAPRFMRATLGVIVAALAIAAYITLHRTRLAFDPASPEELDRIRPLVETTTRSDANLALLGDKRFMVSPSGKGFAMYGIQGRTWVAMGDPVAPEDEVDDLVWQFKELVDRHGGTPVFYQVTTAHLPAYLDAGFSLVKLGEEAWVELSRFTLEGSDGRRLRQSKAKAERSGATFEIIPAQKAAEILPQLEEVSERWLTEKGNKEKGFSLGFWSSEYVVRHDQAVVRHEGRIVAFANIWRGANKQEFTVDLMRYLPDGPAGLMDLLFIGLLAQAKAEGFKWFNLGMAPLSGLPTHRLASLWSRIGAFLYRRGDRFYNFEGLRAYKDKFKPEWRPKYLAFPGGLGLPQVLMDVTSLIAASPRRALAEDKT